MRRLVALFVLGLVACGYHLVGTGGTVPESAHTITIARFHNHTRENGLDVRLHRALEDEFRRHGTLRVVPDDGDLVLSGEIRRLVTRPVASSAADEAVQYEAVLTVAMRLVERESGRVLYENKLLQEVQDFGAESGVIVSSSPHFQRGTINARDLTNLTNVQIGEARRRDALRDLIDVLVRDIYVQATEGF